MLWRSRIQSTSGSLTLSDYLFSRIKLNFQPVLREAAVVYLECSLGWADGRFGTASISAEGLPCHHHGPFQIEQFVVSVKKLAGLEVGQRIEVDVVGRRDTRASTLARVALDHDVNTCSHAGGCSAVRPSSPIGEPANVMLMCDNSRILL